MKKRIEDLTVVENKVLNREFFVLKLQAKDPLSGIMPGQFAEVRVDGSPATFLRRPISIYDVDYKHNTLFLLIKIVGDGTRQLSYLKKDDRLNLVYPLGNYFSKPPGERVLLAGGGTGVAPMLLLGRYLTERHGTAVRFLLGYRSADLIIEKEKFETLGQVNITSEDGSAGEKGLIIHHPVIREKYDMIYTCGPEIMMKAVAKIAKDQNIPCEVSLENLMGCGIGACLCCVVDTVDQGNVNTCTEGPVFNANRLKW
ncbi:MAG: dihydroorotate dehydrogenase electron transfer subunit [Bacteroidales bacterium]|jgi:dihydroorotate dehydrogenase electron transfer subunit